MSQAKYRVVSAIPTRRKRRSYLNSYRWTPLTMTFYCEPFGERANKRYTWGGEEQLLVYMKLHGVRRILIELRDAPDWRNLTVLHMA